MGEDKPHVVKFTREFWARMQHYIERHPEEEYGNVAEFVRDTIRQRLRAEDPVGQRPTKNEMARR